MIGTARGTMVSTEDLQSGQVVLVDHQEFQVVGFEPLPEGGGVAVVLAPAYGHSWTLHVHEVDCQEPMWETI